MPKVLLTGEQRQRDAIKQSNKAFTMALKHKKVDLELTDDEMAKKLGVTRMTYSRWRDRPGVITLDRLRHVVRTLGIDKDTWDVIGGFRPDSPSRSSKRPMESTEDNA